MTICCSRSYDQTRLACEFYRSFDQTAIDSALHKRNRSDLLKKIGQGTHSIVYLYKTTKAMDLVIKLPVNSSSQDHNLNKIFKNYERLMEISLKNWPLIPPIRYLNSLQALIMPFADGELFEANHNWLPLAEQIREMQDLLYSYGFKINDDLQIKCWQSIPFVFDFSDLITIDS